MILIITTKFGTQPNTLLSDVVDVTIVEKNFSDALLKLLTNILNVQDVVEIYRGLKDNPIKEE